MPNSVWMNWRWPTTSPFGNQVRVEYELTPETRRLRGIIHELCLWGGNRYSESPPASLLELTHPRCLQYRLDCTR
jgi:hypothetical protein